MFTMEEISFTKFEMNLMYLNLEKDVLKDLAKYTRLDTVVGLQK